MNTHDLRTPRGHKAVMASRSGTSDLAVLGSTFAGVVGAGLVDEYGLAKHKFAGRFVDVGAHIGSVVVAVLLDNPGVTALAVEPIPENIAVLTANLAANGLLDRCTILAGAVGTNQISYGFEGSENAVTNRYIGNLNVVPQRGSQRITVRRVKLADLLPCDAMKVDCEGGEWALFAEPGIADIPLVFGEYHGSHQSPGAEGVMVAFGKTHRVTFSDMRLDTGNFWAVAR